VDVCDFIHRMPMGRGGKVRTPIMICWLLYSRVIRYVLPGLLPTIVPARVT
jgi:hypothetical protein